MIETCDRETFLPIRISNKDLGNFIFKNKPQIFDRYTELLEDVFLLRNPKFRFDKNYQSDLNDFLETHKQDQTMDDCGKWFYFPWSNELVHFLEEPLHLEMRTGRNKNLILKEEQEKYYNSSVAIAGLSVGSHIASVLTMTGGPKNLHLADLDTISGSNLNRIRTKTSAVGSNKAILVARQIYEVNPYAQITIYPKGITEGNLQKFIQNTDLIIEEMDQPYFKLKIREAAKASKIPLIMGTDNGDNIFVDIERYDTNPDLSIFNGLAGDITSDKLKSLSPKELPRTAARLAGAELATTRMQESVLEVGKTLYSWPQLGTAANLCGSVVAYIVRKILLKTSNIQSGRYEINLDSILENDYTAPENINYRKTKTDKFLKRIGL